MAIDAAGLSALEERAAFTDRSACGRLWITGVDALDLLNRLTTNQLETLPEGLARSTVLTNGDARAIDHLLLAAVDGGLWCLTSPGRAEAVVAYLVRRGVAAPRLRAAGFGESRLLPAFAPADDRQRRVEIVRTF